MLRWTLALLLALIMACTDGGGGGEARTVVLAPSTGHPDVQTSEDRKLGDPRLTPKIDTTREPGTAQVGTPDLQGYGSLLQGFLEMSNVKLVEEMVSMIVAQRAYEISSRSIQAADEMLNVANNLRR